jgi:adenylosuccinate lyase
MNTQAPLLAICPLDGRYHLKLQALAPIVSEYGLIHYRFITELAWLGCLIGEDKLQLPIQNKEKILKKLLDYQNHFNLTVAERVKSQEAITAHDVKALEYTIAEDFNHDADLKPLIPWIHFGCTSDDINNTAYALMLKDSLNQIFLPQLNTIISQLSELAHQSKRMAMLSHTHGQPASPTTMGKVIQEYIHRLQSTKHRLEQTPIMAKFNGAVGNYNAHHFVYPDIDWPALSEKFIESLGLTFQSHSSQIEPGDHLAQSMHVLSQIMTIVIDLTRDIWLYISMNYFSQKLVAHEVGSSTMPHKINPIHFENAEGNAEFTRALCGFLADKLPISRLQRDLSGSTVMRNLGSVIGFATLSLQSLESGLSRLEPNPAPMREALKNAYALLAEPIQMMMRRYGITDAYDQLKAFTRGQGSLSQESFQAFVSSLAIPQEAKARLLVLTPESYLGLAVELACSSFSIKPKQ